MNRNAPEPRDLFAIADLAKEFGISTRAIRFYESKGLLQPERVGGTRIFRRRDRARLILILRGKRLGFSLRDISDYLSLYDAHSQTAQVELLVDKVEERLALLEAQKRDLETTIAELREIAQLAHERLAQETARPAGRNGVQAPGPAG
ncbi:MAG TPA: MerR family DNA-binding transcriptional regulator [Devosiaceae bacterium]|jgi:DNA-binding transcriptional MerR regulator|nr:MerR family DNA-binding transcriptional regulator [Devosiaceae bacterium]